MKAHLECIIPILRDQDFCASTEYYMSRLGFTVDWQGAGHVLRLPRRLLSMLCEGEQG